MLSIWIDYLRYVLETVLASVILAMGVLKKNRFALRTAVMAGLLLLSCVILAWIQTVLIPDPDVLRMTVQYFLLSLLSVGILVFLYDGSPWNLLFSFINGSMLRMCARKFFDVTTEWVQASGDAASGITQGSPLRYLLYYGIMAAIYLLAFLLFGRTYRRNGSYQMSKGIVAVYAVMLSINFLLNRIEPVLRDISLLYYTELALSEAAYYILMLTVQYFLFRMTQSASEAASARELWRKDRQQYEQMKENIETINIKCHDLRHHIREIQQHADGTDSLFLDEVASSISIYDSSIKTGNDALDVVLTEKRLLCERSGIQLTTMADGTALRGMDDSDIYSLFGNLLDNAIEYETTVPDPEKRFISLTVRNMMGKASVHIENYFEGSIELKDGLPATTKADSSLHGYGLKSVRRIADKYDGSFFTQQKDGMFQVSLLLSV